MCEIYKFFPDKVKIYEILYFLHINDTIKTQYTLFTFVCVSHTKQ